VKDLTTTSFGLIIAYLLPGGAFLYGLSFLIDSLKSIANRFFNATADVGLSLTVILAALTTGLIVNSIRWLLYQKLLFSDFQELDYGKLESEYQLKIVLWATEENFRYHQFYGGMAVAMPVIYVGWITRYYPNFVQTIPMKVITALFATISIMTLGIVLLKRPRRGDLSGRSFLKKISAKALIVTGGSSVTLLILGWLRFFPNPFKDRVLFTLLTISFIFVEVLSAANAQSAWEHSAEKRRALIRGG